MKKDNIKIFSMLCISTIVVSFFMAGCVSYVLSGFTVIEKSKFITPSWADKESFFVYEDNLVYVEKLSKGLDLPVTLKEAQKLSIENSRKKFSAYLNDTLMKKIESNGIKIHDKSVVKQIASQQNVYVKNIVLKDIYYEKIAANSPDKDYYEVYVLDQFKKADYINLCTSLINSFKKQKASFKVVVDLLNQDPSNCLKEEL